MPFPQTEKEASICRMLLRFNDNPDSNIKMQIDEVERVLIVVNQQREVLLVIPTYWLTNSEVFRLVSSYITNKLAETKALNH